MRVKKNNEDLRKALRDQLEAKRLREREENRQNEEYMQSWVRQGE
jgi:hypothetical protein